MRRDGGYPLDPTLKVALETVADDVRRFRSWGYELIKHDFSTYDLFGRFAADSLPELADADWALTDRSLTNAEILVRLYRTVAEAAGPTVVIGCHTVGHLAAGLVQVQRTGDDTSGRRLERTRRMGVNTLAFRLAQYNRIFALDADCVPCTPQTDWAMNSRMRRPRVEDSLRTSSTSAVGSRRRRDRCRHPRRPASGTSYRGDVSDGLVMSRLNGCAASTR